MPFAFIPPEIEVLNEFANSAPFEDVHGLYTQSISENPEEKQKDYLTPEAMEAYGGRKAFRKGADVLASAIEEKLPAKKLPTETERNEFRAQLSSLSMPEILNLYGQLYTWSQDLDQAEKNANHKTQKSVALWAPVGVASALLTTVVMTTPTIFFPPILTENCTQLQKPRIERIFTEKPINEADITRPNYEIEPLGYRYDETEKKRYAYDIYTLQPTEILKTTEVLRIPVTKKYTDSFASCVASLPNGSDITHTETGSEKAKFSDVLVPNAFENREIVVRLDPQDNPTGTALKQYDIMDNKAWKSFDGGEFHSIKKVATYQQGRGEWRIPAHMAGYFATLGTMGIVGLSAALQKRSLQSTKEEMAASFTQMTKYIEQQNH